MAQLTVEAVIDSVMNQKKPNTNYGSNPAITHQVTYDITGKSAWFRSIGNFDVSALAGASILSAKLVREVYSVSNGGKEARVSRCTRPSQWTEGGVTWNMYDGVNNWTNVGGDLDDTGPPAAITYIEPFVAGTHEVLGLKGFVEDALANRGGIVSIITRLLDEDPGVTTQYLWRSKEYGSNVWRLVVDYSTSEPRRSVQAGSLARGAPAARPGRPSGATRPTPPNRAKKHTPRRAR